MRPFDELCPILRAKREGICHLPREPLPGIDKLTLSRFGEHRPQTHHCSRIAGKTQLQPYSGTSDHASTLRGNDVSTVTAGGPRDLRNRRDSTRPQPSPPAHRPGETERRWAWRWGIRLASTTRASP